MKRLRPAAFSSDCPVVPPLVGVRRGTQVAQHRLTPAAAADVARLLGANHDATTQCVSESAA